MTQYFDQIDPDNADYDYMVSEDWAVTDRINIDAKQNFTSWQQFYGPLTYNSDNFSRIQEYNLTSSVYDYDALYYNSTSYPLKTRQDPWNANDIVILTDGICASACSLFVEIATQQLGVRTVVVGGSPKATPMQAASGTRGALMYWSDDLDDDFATAEAIINGTDIAPSTAPVYLNDTGMYITYATVNLRDQIRPAHNAGGVPNQFLYLPANCRLYWTLDNFSNYTRLWSDVSNSIYEDQTICVGGFQDTIPQSKRSLKSTDEQSLRKRSSPTSSRYISRGLSSNIESIPDNAPSSGFRDTNGVVVQAPITYCTSDLACRGMGICRKTTRTCKKQCGRGSSCGTTSEPISVCAPRLSVGSPCSGQKIVAGTLDGKRSSAVFKPGSGYGNIAGDASLQAYCMPSSASLGQPVCSAKS